MHRCSALFRAALVVLLVQQMLLGSLLHIGMAVEEAGQSGLALGMLCSASGSGQQQPQQHHDHECCVVGCCSTLAAPGIETAASWTGPSLVTVRLAPSHPVAALPRAARFASDMPARGPPAAAA
mgnify:CR=1 FL=1